MRHLVLLLSYSLLLTLSSQRLAAEPKNELDLSCTGCNVLFLDIDLLRADFVGIINSETANTPNINEFFKHSIIFQDVSASSGVTAISNTATLTARDGHFTYHLLKNTFVDLPPQMPLKYLELYSGIPTIAQVLRSSGYETLNVNHGWYAGKQMLLDRGFNRYWGTGEANSTSNDPGAAIDKTIEFILEQANLSTKFFLLMRSEDLRGFPYRYPVNRKRLEDRRVVYRQGDASFVEVRYQINEDGILREGYVSFEYARWMSDIQLKEFQSLGKSIYSQQLSYVDEKLGELFSQLKKQNILDNTIVVLYSNHGDGLYDNYVPNHGVSYQSCVSVPMLVRHPKIKASIVVSTPVALIDLVPTIYEFLSIPSPREFDGVTLANVVRGSKYPKKFFFGTDKVSQYVRHGNLKLIVWADRTKQLFDLSLDPREEINLAEKYPQIVALLDGKLSEHGMIQLSKAFGRLKSYK